MAKKKGQGGAGKVDSADAAPEAAVDQAALLDAVKLRVTELEEELEEAKAKAVELEAELEKARATTKGQADRRLVQRVEGLTKERADLMAKLEEWMARAEPTRERFDKMAKEHPEWLPRERELRRVVARMRRMTQILEDFEEVRGELESKVLGPMRRLRTDLRSGRVTR